MSEEEFLLKWNNHQSNFVDVINELLNGQAFVDVTLVCGGEAVLGHKMVLAACSPLLRRILAENPCEHPLVILSDVTGRDMRAVMRFIYRGEVSVSQDDLAGFLKTADNLQIKGLAEDREREEGRRREGEAGTEEGAIKRHKGRAGAGLVSSTRNRKGGNGSGSRRRKRKRSPERKVDVINVSNVEVRDDLHGVNCHDVCQSPAMEDQRRIKNEPLELAGEVLWKEGSSPGSCDALDMKQNLLPLAVFTGALESISTVMATSPLVESGDENSRCDDDNRGDMLLASDDALAINENEDSSMEEGEGASGGSPGKFRGGRKPCCFCGKTFCDNYTLRRHMVTHLTRERQFECPMCNAAYSRKDHLMAHVRRKHPLDIDQVDLMTLTSGVLVGEGGNSQCSNYSMDTNKMDAQ